MNKKTVLITGCSSGGLGHALVLALQQRGLHVFATARTPSKMSDLGSIPDVTLLQLDVTSAADIAAAVEAVRSQTGGSLDYLINNSGSQFIMPLLDSDLLQARSMFDVNFWAPIALTQAFAPLLIQAKGCVVNICSISGYLYSPWMSIYNASKSALTMLGETLRLELEPLHVRVISVVTGAIDTNIMTNSPVPHLPATSRYTSISKQITARAVGEEKIERTSAHDYAERVARDILDPSTTGLVWRGKNASVTRFASSFFPHPVIDRLLRTGTGVDDLCVG